MAEAGLEPATNNEGIDVYFLFSTLSLFPSPNSLEVEHQSCKLEVLSSILSLGSTFDASALHSSNTLLHQDGHCDVTPNSNVEFKKLKKNSK